MEKTLALEITSEVTVETLEALTALETLATLEVSLLLVFLIEVLNLDFCTIN